jgi:hypothetical protein
MCIKIIISELIIHIIHISFINKKIFCTFAATTNHFKPKEYEKVKFESSSYSARR